MPTVYGRPQAEGLAGRQGGMVRLIGAEAPNINLKGNHSAELCRRKGHELLRIGNHPEVDMATRLAMPRRE